MGHLSNPIGFRLNYERKWASTFFIKPLYYSEFMNTIIQIRDYLYYYLTRKKLLYSGLLLSHFNVSKYLKLFVVKIYLYHIDIEKSSHSLINLFYQSYYDAYNETCTLYRNTSRLQDSVELLNIARDLSNSDLFVFVYIYVVFYLQNFKAAADLKKYVVNRKTGLHYRLDDDDFEDLLRYNKYAQNKKLNNYKLIIKFSYFKQLVRYYNYFKKFRIIKKYQKYINVKNQKLYFKKYNKIKLLFSYLYKKFQKQNTFKRKYYNLDSYIKGKILYQAKKIIKLMFKTKKKDSDGKITSSTPFDIFHWIKFLSSHNMLRGSLYRNWAICYILILAKRITVEKLNRLYKNKMFKSLYIKKEYECNRKYFLKKMLYKFREIFFMKKFNFLQFLLPKKYINKGERRRYNRICLRKQLLPDTELYFKDAVEVGVENLSKFKIYKKNPRYIKLDIFSLFLYLCKKINIPKVRNSKSLWWKMLTVYKNLQLYKALKLIKNEPKTLFNNLEGFFFYLKSVIVSSWSGHLGFVAIKRGFGRGFGIPFNFRNYIFGTIHYAVYKIFFFDLFQLLGNLLKYYLYFIINSVYNYVKEINNITITFFFIDNNDVTSPFIARYIVLKLKKGFSIKKTLGPLHRELRRLATSGSWNQPAYKPYLRNNLHKKKIVDIKYKTVIEDFMDQCLNFFFILFFKHFKNNNILLYYNNFLLLKYKKYKIKNKNYKMNFCFWLKLKAIYKNQTFEILDKNEKETQNFINNVFLLSFQNFQFILSYDLATFKEKNKMSYITFPLILNFVNSIYFLYKQKKKIINTLQISFSAYFNKNLLNYNAVSTLWTIYNKLNKRNERDLYIPRHHYKLMGYKIVLKGRFSRKQRASKATFTIGKVPLNTLKYSIDFAHMTQTLKNSVISLKLYMYRNLALNTPKYTIQVKDIKINYADEIVYSN